MSRFVFGFSHRAIAGVFDMPNSYRYNILLILIFSKIPLFISIFSRKLISISISSRKFMSISIFSRKFISISIFSKSINISTINISYWYIYILIYRTQHLPKGGLQRLTRLRIKEQILGYNKEILKETQVISKYSFSSTGNKIKHIRCDSINILTSINMALSTT